MENTMTVFHYKYEENLGRTLYTQSFGCCTFGNPAKEFKRLKEAMKEHNIEVYAYYCNQEPLVFV